MNERIKELAKQATIRKFDGTGTDMGKLVLDEQKFAELIVRECAGLLEKEAESNYDEGTDVYDKLILESKWIKEYFGVEE